MKRAKYANKIHDERQPLYTPLFIKPHPLLTKEFCDFYGLYQDSEAAKKANIDVFPADGIVLVGSSSKAVAVTSCISIDDDDVTEETIKGNRSYKFFRLGLLSKEVRSLFAGAAKFNPMEAGLALCWVPIPGTGSAHPKSDETTSDNRMHPKDIKPLSSTSSSPVENRGRYGLADEAVEFIGRYATRRVVDLPRDEVLKLLEFSTLQDSNNVPKDWSNGGIIVRYTLDNDVRSKLFLSCKLTQRGSAGTASDGSTLQLLTERRYAASWFQLLQSQSSHCNHY
jgi:hypothetical protein